MEDSEKVNVRMVNLDKAKITIEEQKSHASDVGIACVFVARRRSSKKNGPHWRRRIESSRSD